MQCLYQQETCNITSYGLKPLPQVLTHLHGFMEPY